MNSLDHIEEHGFAIRENVLDAAVIRSCCELLETARRSDNSENVTNSSGTYGLRNLTDVVPQIADLVRLPAVADLVKSVVGQGAFMVRATLFDKTPGANWGVFWHQDLSIAVRKRHDIDGFSSWTRKAGVQCVQPPVEFMQNILAVRLHLDECTAANGALKVLPGTHRLSRLSMPETAVQQQRVQDVVCEVSAGGALLMRPLLLHASSPMECATSRRVIHFEFASLELPSPLEWKYRIPCPVSMVPSTQPWFGSS